MGPAEVIDARAAAMGDSPWALLRDRNFRRLWLAAFCLYLAVWMQNVGIAWLMATLVPSPLMIALVQTAAYVPACVFALPGGILADRLERRCYLLAVHAWMLAVAVLLCLLTMKGAIDPWRLLFVTFAFGCGYALQAPAWHASQLDAVPKKLLPEAVILASIPYSTARALGPALAGMVIATLGPGTVFLAVAAGLGMVLVLLLAWQGGASAGTAVRPGFAEALREVLGYVRRSRPCRVRLLSTAIFVAGSSGLTALLPALVRDRMAGGAGIYGLLVASSALGAVIAALLLPGLLRRNGRNAVALGAIGACAVATLGAAFLHQVLILCTFVFVAGGAWLMMVNIELGAMQSAVPGGLRARSVAMFLLVCQGAQAVGSVLWGGMAERWGLAWTFAGEAVVLLGALLVIRRLGGSVAWSHASGADS